ncbi:MAG: hypothetical protein U0414_03795 [Polyangiaceae bacterium]
MRLSSALLAAGILTAAALGAACDGASSTGGGAGGTTSSTTSTTAVSATTSTSTSSVSSGSTSSGGPTVTIDDVQDKVLGGCQGHGIMSCHGKDPFEGDLDLRPGHARAALVDQPSTQALGKTLVIPGDRDASFLWQKLTNMLPSDGSEGDPMPKGEAIMWSLPPQDQLDLITAWIEGGAL